MITPINVLQLLSCDSQKGDDQGGISGHYQCRRDITNHDCHSCVLKLPHITNTHCSRAIAAKIQLSGCSLNYEADSFAEATDQLPAEGIKYGMEHKVCSQERVETEGFNELRDSAFEELETGVLTRQGYCRANRESFQAVAQCDEDMGGCECGKCISEAVETVKAECKMAASGQVFLGRCSVSYVYGYHGEGFPFPGYQEGDEGGEHHTGRKIAIVLGGGAAAVLVGLILLALLGFGLKRKCGGNGGSAASPSGASVVFALFYLSALRRIVGSHQASPEPAQLLAEVDEEGESDEGIPCVHRSSYGIFLAKKHPL
ncbi:hypothetical protein SAY86_005703 [Trapa natans]|uniref:Gnk2-homologous domain-containing protein n=1 Tax=Trapa natans TaxID=22666 RepID=A0AAN7L1X6_TRANT|nr:hypothetical protein SAY86_005703 [Trapa natans]